MALSHSSILAQRILWTDHGGHKELDMIERLTQEAYFRREFSPVLPIHDIARWDNNTCSDPGNRFKFTLRVTQTQSDEPSLNQKL